jgi:transposase
MLQITPQMKILVAVAPVDFRKGIDGLVQLCKEAFEQDAFSGTLFVFRNRRATALKALVYDGQGFWLCHKRLSEGRFRWWPTSSGGASQALAAHQLQVLFSAGNPLATGAAPDWRPLGAEA